MNRVFSVLIAILIFAILGGCASAPYMPLSEKNPALDSSKPLYLMSVVIKNDYKARWQPKILNVILRKDGGAQKAEATVFRMDSQGAVDAIEDDGPVTFLVRFTTDGTPISIAGMNAMASAFPVHGFYFVPLHSSVPQHGPGIYYLGTVKATIRERRDNEFRAGPVIPLIDQAFAGASGGTFDIEFGDSYSIDVEKFTSAFPALKGATIVKSQLAPWNRATAQLEWEKN